MGFVGLTFLLLVDDVLTEQIVVTQNDWGTQFRKFLLKPDHLVSKTRDAGHLTVQPLVLLRVVKVCRNKRKELAHLQPEV